MVKSKKSAFQLAIENTTDVCDGYCSGIQAIKGSDRSKIVPHNPKNLEGSLDIDTCTLQRYPKDTRWDYAISYNGKVCFLEIHPAYDKEVKKMMEKLQWLKDWLKNKAPQIGSLPKYEKPFCWVPSGETGFLSSSSTRKKIALSGISYENKLVLK